MVGREIKVLELIGRYFFTAEHFLPVRLTLAVLDPVHQMSIVQMNALPRNQHDSSSQSLVQKYVQHFSRFLGIETCGKIDKYEDH